MSEIVNEISTMFYVFGYISKTEGVTNPILFSLHFPRDVISLDISRKFISQNDSA